MKKKAKTVQACMRVDASLVERADRLRPVLALERGKAASRADVLRAAIVAGVKALESRQG